jgi:hypothetical protein
MQAAKSGSETAMEMLLRLPDMDSSMEGWMFEYIFKESLKYEPVVSKRWVFHEARKIDNPVSREDKLASLRALIAG